MELKIILQDQNLFNWVSAGRGRRCPGSHINDVINFYSDGNSRVLTNIYILCLRGFTALKFPGWKIRGLCEACKVYGEKNH